jgi:PHD/YefM family antitoxin component YafN of YafNO toxin-antitoxin module
MREVTISEFRTKCFSLLNQVQKTKQPLRVTRGGHDIRNGLSEETKEPTRPSRRAAN